MSPTGARPGRASGKVYRGLADYEERTGLGYAYPDNVGFIVNLPRRQSISPDAAFSLGPDPGMRFRGGAPIFAVEVRSERDYGRKPRATCAKSAPITSPQAPKLSGMWTCSVPTLSAATTR